MGRSGLILGSALAAGVGTAAYMVVARPKAVAPFRFSFFRYLRPHARPTFVAAAAMGAAQTGLTIMPNQYPQTGRTALPNQYRQVRRDPKVVDVLHGVSVADPYRWLEDPDSEETTKFVEAQNALTKTALDQCDTRSKFIDLFTAVFDYPKFGTPFRSGKRYYYYHNSGLQAQYVLMSQAALGAEASVLLDPNTLSEDKNKHECEKAGDEGDGGEASVELDPNTLSEDGTISLSGMAFSDCGTYLSYSLSSGGSDWSEIQVMSIDQATGKTTELSDKYANPKNVKDLGTETETNTNNSAIMYPDPKKIKDLGTETETKTSQMLCNLYPDPKNIKDLGTETETNTDQMLCYHVLGTNQSEDTLVMAMPDHPTWMMGAEVTDDGRYILLTVSEGCVPANHIYYVDMQKLEKKVDGGVDFTAHDFKTGRLEGCVPANHIYYVDMQKLEKKADGGVDFAAHDYKTGKKKLPVEDRQANITKPAHPPVGWTFLGVPKETGLHVPSESLGRQSNHPATLPVEDGTFDCVPASSYLVCMPSQIKPTLVNFRKLKKELPTLGGGSIPGSSRSESNQVFLFVLLSRASQAQHEPSPRGNDLEKQGAQYRVDLEKAGEEDPTLFRRTELKVAHNPSEYETNQVFVASKDGTKVPIFITHKKGIKRDGSNPTLLYGYGGFNISLEPGFSASRYEGFNIILEPGRLYGFMLRGSRQLVKAVAEYLIKEGFCSSKKLAIQGGSNGGLLVAACANQRPDLYACVIGQVGVMDMLRFHKFTIGHAWTTDYGSADNLKDFELA
eukprot:gene13564-19435_t